MRNSVLATSALLIAVVSGCTQGADPIIPPPVPPPSWETGPDTSPTDNQTPPVTPPAEAPVDTTHPTTPPPPSQPPAQPPAQPQPLDCGPNALESNGVCECVNLYSVCDPTEVSLGCCAYGADTFEINFVGATVLPYKDAANLTPWDWSGSVPSWLNSTIGDVVTYVDEDAASWVDVADYVTLFAPTLLQGVTPPDAFLEVKVDGSSVLVTDTESNTIEPFWDHVETLTILENTDLLLRFRDQDLDFDDNIAEIELTQEDLQWLSGLGEIEVQGTDGVYSFTVEVEPVLP